MIKKSTRIILCFVVAIVVVACLFPPYKEYFIDEDGIKVIMDGVSLIPVWDIPNYRVAKVEHGGMMIEWKVLFSEICIIVGGGLIVGLVCARCSKSIGESVQNPK
ncbi:MAG: hypothetical protein PHV34_14615 [Verrucomicrobiae bacterium]|nr:hypothetical protein [Verrucomicrobiae bacterium]